MVHRIDEQASHEQDPNKLLELVSELCEAIDERPKPVARVENSGDQAHNIPTENDVPKSKIGTDSQQSAVFLAPFTQPS